MTRKVEETDIVMQEVETVSQQYLPLSTACSSIYFTMESLKQVGGPHRAGGSPPPRAQALTAPLRPLQIHFLYQYSLQFFLDIYHNVLYENPNLKGVTDHTQRLSIITKDLFQVQRGPAAPAWGCAWDGGRGCALQGQQRSDGALRALSPGGVQPRGPRHAAPGPHHLRHAAGQDQAQGHRRVSWPPQRVSPQRTLLSQ